MITWEEAYRLASDHVAGRALADETDALVIDDRYSLEHDLGWTFVPQSRSHLATGDPGTRLIGNVPFLVDRRDGSIHSLRQPWRLSLAAYAHEHPLGPTG